MLEETTPLFRFFPIPSLFKEAFILLHFLVCWYVKVKTCKSILNNFLLTDCDEILHFHENLVTMQFQHFDHPEDRRMIIEVVEDPNNCCNYQNWA